MILVAEAFEQMGLVGEAWNALNVGFLTLNDYDRFAPDLILYLAKLYGKIGRFEDGLRTLSLIKQKNYSAEVGAQLFLLEGQFHTKLKQFDKAKVSFNTAARLKADPVVVALHSALNSAESGDCPQAKTDLRGVSFDEEVIKEFKDPYPFFVVAPCYYSKDAPQNQKDRAIKIVKLAMDKTTIPDELIRGQYLLAEYTNTVETVITEDEEKNIWGKLLKEKQESLKFDKEFEDWKENSK